MEEATKRRTWDTVIQIIWGPEKLAPESVCVVYVCAYISVIVFYVYMGGLCVYVYEHIICGAWIMCVCVCEYTVCECLDYMYTRMSVNELCMCMCACLRVDCVCVCVHVYSA